MLKCAICKVADGEATLVRDHDHETGFIRGILCDLCNSWLGVHESNIKRARLGRKLRGRRRFIEWLAKYKTTIDQYLKTAHTGYRYRMGENVHEWAARAGIEEST